MSPNSSSSQIAWRRQGVAVVGALTLSDGSAGNVVLVGARSNPKGAAMVMPGRDGGGSRTVLLPDGLSLLHPRQVIDILCMQERVFGASKLPAPETLEAAP